MILSILLNIPKFLEAKHETLVYQDENNITQERVIFNVTSLRVNPDYMYYYIHWTRLLCTGLIPFSYLSSMNMLIYNRMSQNNLSTVRSRSNSTKKAGNLAAILIVIGENTSTGNKKETISFSFQFLFSSHPTHQD